MVEGIKYFVWRSVVSSDSVFSGTVGGGVEGMMNLDLVISVRTPDKCLIKFN